ncbi:MAG: serine protease, partial [Polaromonas sp. 28-63-22]
FALQMLPVSYTGLALIVLGISLMVGEHFAPGFGVLGLGGVVAFIVGSIMLIDTDSPGYRIPWPLIAGVAAASVGFLLVVLNFALRARRRPVLSGCEQLLDATGEVLAGDDGHGSARILGEVWQVRASAPLGRGQIVRVVGIDGLVLSVEPAGLQGDAT